MDKVIRALMATGAEMHWSYDAANEQYVVRLFGGQKARSLIIGRKAAEIPFAAEKFAKKLVRGIYQIGEVE